MQVIATCQTCGHRIEVEVEPEPQTSRLIQAIKSVETQAAEHRHDDEPRWRLGYEVQLAVRSLGP